MGGSRTSIMRRTMKKMKYAATLGVYLVVYGLPRGPLWLSVCNMPTPDLNEVDENKKPFYMRICLWEGHIHISFEFDFSSPSEMMSSTEINLTPKRQKIAKF